MDIPSELWDLANGITGFYIAQDIVMSYAFVKKDTQRFFQAHPIVQRTIAGLKSVVFLAFLFLLWRCYDRAVSADGAISAIWREMTAWRMIAISYFFVISMVSLFAYARFRVNRSGQANGPAVIGEGETELLIRGTAALVTTLGEADAHRFIALIRRESLDHPKGRLSPTGDQPIE